MATPSRRSAPRIAVINGQPTTTSRDIAETFGKQHKDVLRRIRALECSPEFNQRNFAPIEFTDGKGAKQEEFRITRDGFAFLCMGFTGAKAAAWKEKYIAHFNAMAEKLAQKQQKSPPALAKSAQGAIKPIALLENAPASAIGRGLPPLPEGLVIPPEIARQIDAAVVSLAIAIAPALRSYIERRVAHQARNAAGWMPERVADAIAGASLADALNYEAHRDLRDCISAAAVLQIISTQTLERMRAAQGAAA